mgnify:CR=1 FL=1
MHNVWQLMGDTGMDTRKERGSIIENVICKPEEEGDGDDCNGINDVDYDSDEFLGLQPTLKVMSDDDNVLNESISASDTPDDFDSSEINPGGYQDWGTNRRSQDNKKKCRGFPWTAKELEIVKEWKVLNPSGSIKRCLEDIYAKQNFRREFHVHHVINSTRLLTAWKKC